MTITPAPVPGQWVILAGERVRVVGEFPANPERLLIQTPAGRVLSPLVSDLTILGRSDMIPV